MTGVAITILVKTAGHTGEARIHYAEVDDYLARQEKLDVLNTEHDITGTSFQQITPNEHGDWINQRDDRYLEFQEIGDKRTKGKPDTLGVFTLYSSGLQTNRDVWCYNFSRAKLEANMQRMISNYNAQIDSGIKDLDQTKVSWSSSLDNHFKNGRKFDYRQEGLQTSIYRPFCKQNVYYDRFLNHRVYQLSQIFPTPEQPNLSFGITGDYRKEWSLIIADCIPDLNVLSATTFFPLYTWQKIESQDDSLFAGFDLSSGRPAPPEFAGVFDFTRPIGEQVPLEIGGYRRQENITDATLAAYREHYQDARSPQGEQISKEDIFFYIYALLHHPEYRERYAADLKKMLPRIPKACDFWSYSLIGRELAELHVNYERVEPYPSVMQQWGMVSLGVSDWEKYRIAKPAWAKGKSAKEKDFTTLVYNDYLTFTGIPEVANDYKIGGRSPLEWVIDRYRITADKKSGIRNDPNDYCREIGDPAYIAKLIPALVTVSMRTQSLMKSLPEFTLEEGRA